MSLTASVPTRSRSGKTRVLLVEDDKHTVKAVRSLLRRLGCTTVHADRISQARRLAKSEIFDIALLDIDLPDGSGLDVVLHLRSAKHPCASMILTGSRRQSNLREAVGLGVSEYLLKPVSFDALGRALKTGVERTKHMRGWLGHVPGGKPDKIAVTRPPLGLGKRPTDLVHQVAIEFTLTHRESDALTLVAEGFADREISEQLDVSYSRVRQLLSKGFGKMGLRSRNDFIRFLCERHGA